MYGPLLLPWSTHSATALLRAVAFSLLLCACPLKLLFCACCCLPVFRACASPLLLCACCCVACCIACASCVDDVRECVQQQYVVVVTLTRYLERIAIRLPPSESSPPTGVPACAFPTSIQTEKPIRDAMYWEIVATPRVDLLSFLAFLAPRPKLPAGIRQRLAVARFRLKLAGRYVWYRNRAGRTRADEKIRVALGSDFKARAML